MIDTILFDLDGTLLEYSQRAFIDTYFAEINKVFAQLGLNPELAVKALWAGTKAMILNDGEKLNAERFWDHFAAMTNMSGEGLRAVEDACDRFYSNEFHALKSIIKTDDPDLPCRVVRTLVSRGFNVVLATNPLFPACAVTTRLSWIGLSPQDFCLTTDYANSAFSKPNLNYYRAILQKINKEPHQCLMVGNNAREDMCVKELGMETYLVTNYLENETNMDTSSFRQGPLKEMEIYLASLKA